MNNNNNNNNAPSKINGIRTRNINRESIPFNLNGNNMENPYRTPPQPRRRLVCPPAPKKR
jgi:hypothetical protein